MANDWTRAQVRAREPAGSTRAGFAFVGCGDPLMPLLPFKAWPGPKIWPPTAARTFSQGPEGYRAQPKLRFCCRPRVKGLNARWPLKVHPKCRLEGIGASAPCDGRDWPAHGSPRIPGSPAALLELWRGICRRRSLGQRVRPPTSATPRPSP
jgi:hypothetical protein